MSVEAFLRLGDRRSGKLHWRSSFRLVTLAVTASILAAGQIQAQEETIRQVSILKILANLKRYPRAQKRAILQMDSIERIQLGYVIEAGHHDWVAARQQEANAERAKVREEKR